MKLARPLRQEILRERLDQLVDTFDVTTITPDPLELVLAQNDPLDREIAGLLASAFAYGRADIVVKNVGAVLRAMTPTPSAWLASKVSETTRGPRFDRRAAAKQFATFSHRFHKTPDLVALLERIALAIRLHGSLGALFEQGYDAADPDIGPSLSSFVDALLTMPGATPATAGLRYLLSSPEDGSACKRMNLFLRWMVRRTPPDLGLWSFADPAKLIMPLDTHVHRIATFLGLNGRKTASWKTAKELTVRLQAFDAADPVRYDFAICRLGILDRCSRRRAKAQCDVCLLRDVCRFPVR